MWYLPTNIPFSIPNHMYPWLTDAGSLVLRLKREGALAPRILSWHQYWGCPLEDERIALGSKPRKYALIREVLIGDQNKPYVFGRTIFPKTILTGPEKQLAHLGHKTLGSVLFKNPLLQRSAFEVALIKTDSRWYRHIEKRCLLDQQDLWARRSAFSIGEKRMLVSEVFLPGLFLL
ncbi:MAG: chorismate lyase [Gammaproteobacteria bacterium]